ncbi:MAG: hypothetical protein ACRCU9_06205 [Iodobacter sp.]
MKALISKLLVKPMAFCDTRHHGYGSHAKAETDEDLERRLRKAAMIAAAKMEEWRCRCRERV